MAEAAAAESFALLLEASVGAEVGAGVGATALGLGALETAGASSLASTLANSVGAEGIVGVGETALGLSGAEGLATSAFGPASQAANNRSLASTLENSVGAEGLAGVGATALLPVGVAPAASGFSFPSLSQVGTGLNIGSALYGMTQADQMKRLAMMQANKASPWQTAGGADLASQQLMALLSGQTDISTMPGYKAGEQAVQRSMAAQGYQGSGNMMAALQQYGGNFYNNAVSQLGQLSGAQFNPASSGTLAMQGGQNALAAQLAAMSLLGRTTEVAGAK